MQTNNKSTVLSFKYTTSKGRDTYGYNIVTLYANGERVARTCGGGYDMRGTCLGHYITEQYRERIETLQSNYGSEDRVQGFYGLVHVMPSGQRVHNNLKNDVKLQTEPKTYIDGACGESCVVRIAEAVGVFLESKKMGPNEWGYILEDRRSINKNNQK